jgi:hypothetical protein
LSEKIKKNSELKQPLFWGYEKIFNNENKLNEKIKIQKCFKISDNGVKRYF